MQLTQAHGQGHMKFSSFVENSSYSARLIALLMFVSAITAAQIPGTFAQTGDLNTGRNGHRAIMLNDGDVLVVGGWDVRTNGLASTELYKALTGAFSLTGNLNGPRRNFTVTLLPNGTVLVAGGYDDQFNALASAE